jgi:hypothetical protein
MARSKTKLICPVCGLTGGTFCMRRAGRGQKHCYFYIGHYISSTKKKDWCQIKMGWKYAGLADIEFADHRYQEYKLLLENITRYHWAKEDRSFFYDSRERELLTKGCKLLCEFGWPSHWAYTKFVEDWKKMSRTLQSGAYIPINKQDKEKRRLRNEYKKTILDIKLMLQRASMSSP